MQLAFFLEEMQNIMLSAELFVPGVPLQQGCQGSLGRNLATKAGGVLQLGPDTVLHRRELVAILLVDIPIGL